MAYRIPVINQNERFLDLNEQPLVNGKVEILDPVSNNSLTVWSYTDDEYTVMTNPVRLDIEGRVPQHRFSTISLQHCCWSLHPSLLSAASRRSHV